MPRNGTRQWTLGITSVKRCFLDIFLEFVALFITYGENGIMFFRRKVRENGGQTEHTRGFMERIQK